MERSVEVQFRRMLFALSAATFLAAAVELALVEHVEEALQIAPFGMIAVGLGAIGWAWASPRPASLHAMRWVAGAVVVGSLVGVGLHVRGNLGFALEVQPDATTGERIWEAVSGVSPLLAPGMLALAALLGAAATYRHPALER